MAEIKLNKRYKYAGDIFQKLIGIGFDVETATAFLNEIEDADVVEVVRCKDCYYCRESDTTNRFFCTYQDTEFETYPNSYCSNGTPKERGGEK